MLTTGNHTYLFVILQCVFLMNNSISLQGINKQYDILLFPIFFLQLSETKEMLLTFFSTRVLRKPEDNNRNLMGDYFGVVFPYYRLRKKEHLIALVSHQGGSLTSAPLYPRARKSFMFYLNLCYCKDTKRVGYHLR